MPAFPFTRGLAVAAMFAALVPFAAALPGELPPQGEKNQAKPANQPAPEYRPLDLVVSSDQAIGALQQKIKDDPKDVLSHVLLGHMHIRKARETGDFSSYQKAEEVVRRALELDKSNLSARGTLAQILCANHRFADGLQLAQQLASEYPREAQILFLIGDAHLELGNYAAAEKAYQELQQRDPAVHLLSRQARLAELKGDSAEALRLMQRAVEEERRAVMSRQAGAWYQTRLGEIHFNAGHLEAAANHYQAALEEAPHYYVALAGLGRVRAAQGKPDDAIALYKQAVAISPDPLVLTPLGDLYLKTGDQYLAGVIHGKLEKMARNQPAYNRELSSLYSDHDRNLAQAVELARKDLAVRKDVYAYDTLAWALCKNKQYDEAAKAMAEALKLGTRDASFYYHAGMIHQGLGDNAKARAFLQQALQINPYFSLLQAEQAKRTLAALGN